MHFHSKYDRHDVIILRNQTEEEKSEERKGKRVKFSKMQYSSGSRLQGRQLDCQISSPIEGIKMSEMILVCISSQSNQKIIYQTLWRAKL
jgi:hypothetical protein